MFCRDLHFKFGLALGAGNRLETEINLGASANRCRELLSFFPPFQGKLVY
jgi:hypothetical protein